MLENIADEIEYNAFNERSKKSNIVVGAGALTCIALNICIVRF